jgi:thioredoxin-related protein
VSEPYGTYRYSPYLTGTIRNTQIRTSQETHYVSFTETNRLILFGETVAVYCENHTEHTDTVRTSQETHYVSTTGSKRLMLFGETVAVYCENHTEHTDTVRTSQEPYGTYRYSPYLTGNTLRLGFRQRPIGYYSCIKW